LKRLLEQIDREILAAGGKRSRSRAVVIEGFFRARDHITIEELTRSVRESAPGIGGGARRYESNLSPHHDHLVCRQCGTVIEFKDREIENLQDLVTRRHGFHPTAHRLEIYGFCRKCASGKSPGRFR